MKEEVNKEMDLLLRRLGRRDDAPVSNAADSHLDADELSAYAENALPAAARARYTAHLAECSQCRQLVVQLSSSLGVVATSETVKVAVPSAWKRFLASLFTPMVLRYAVPALGLIVVAAIGFVVLRRQESARYVTQVTSNEQSPAAAPPAAPAPTAYDSLDKSEPSAGVSNDRQTKTQTGNSPAPAPPNTPPVVSSVETQVSTDRAAAKPKPEQQPTAVANEPPPPKAAPAPTPEESAKTADTEAKKEEVRIAAAPAASTEQRGLQAAQREDKDSLARSRKSKAEPGDAAGRANVGSAGIASRDAKLFNAPTQVVAGRRFQKRDGVWIDTAYDASKDAVTLARNSEQYRALVADEPAIKTIADTLDGEIIVVWKGHTYRIR